MDAQQNTEVFKTMTQLNKNIVDAIETLSQQCVCRYLQQIIIDLNQKINKQQEKNRFTQ